MPTEREALINARIGQGQFRADVGRYWGGCAVTTVKSEKFLRASHIKPWRDSTNKQRLDKFNGLFLTPNLDHAFDAKLISFDARGKIIISPRLNAAEAEALGSSVQMKLRKLHPEHQKYLRWHRRGVL